MAEAKWRQVLKRPAGVMPDNVVWRITIVVASVMVAALLLTQAGGGPEEEGFGEADPGVVDGGFLGQIEGQMERAAELLLRQERQAEEEQRRAAAEEQAAAARAALSARAGTLPGGNAGGTAGDPEVALTPGEAELREALRLEALERRTRSLRAPSLVQTFRGQEDAAGAGPRGGPAEAAVQAAGNGPDEPPLAEPAAGGQVMPGLDPGPGGGAGADPAVRAVSGAAGPEGAAPAEPARVTAPADPPGFERVYEGALLSAVLVNQLDGDFTGPVLGQVAIPFYSRDRQRILVPRGTRLLGAAQAVGDQDQSRLAVGFHRLVWPDGRWVDLAFEGLNQLGESALEDEVNRHYWSMFAGAGAVGVLAGLTLQGSNPYGGGMAGFRAGAGQGLGQSATQILQRFLNRMPTITIRAGHRLRVWVTSDFLVPRPAPHPERMFR